MKEPNAKLTAMYDYVYIDEKWFYFTMVQQKCYLMLDDESQH